MSQEIGENINNMITMGLGFIVLSAGIIVKVKKIKIQNFNPIFMIIAGLIISMTMAFTFV